MVVDVVIVNYVLNFIFKYGDINVYFIELLKRLNLEIYRNIFFKINLISYFWKLVMF